MSLRSRHRGLDRASRPQKRMRVPLSKAVRNPRYMKLYVKEWLGLKRKEGAICLAAGLVAGLIVLLITREMQATPESASWIVWAMAAVPIALLGYATLALIWPQALFRILHQREDIAGAFDHSAE